MKLQQHLLKLDGFTSRFPLNGELKNAFEKRPVYNDLGSKKLRYLLKKIELNMRSKFDEDVTIDPKNLTIEHIMPQKWAENWPLPNGKTVDNEEPYGFFSDKDLSSETKALMEERENAKHAFGNLTMITNSLNPSLSNQNWENKKSEFSNSLLAINRGIAVKENWDENAITQRGKLLADIAINIWSQPQKIDD